MRGCANTSDRPLAVRRLLCLVAACMLVVSVRAEAPGIEVVTASGAVVNGIYVVNARLTYALGDDATEALRSGIPLVLVLEINLLRARPYLWSTVVARRSERFSIERHALSERYVVTDMARGERRTFERLGDALAAIGAVDGLPIIDRAQLDPAAHYTVRIRSFLDLDTLPAPLRPLAYIMPAWHLRSGWHEWDVRA